MSHNVQKSFYWCFPATLCVFQIPSREKTIAYNFHLLVTLCAQKPTLLKKKKKSSVCDITTGHRYFLSHVSFNPLACVDSNFLFSARQMIARRQIGVRLANDCKQRSDMLLSGFFGGGIINHIRTFNQVLEWNIFSDKGKQEFQSACSLNILFLPIAWKLGENPFALLV